MDKLATNRVEGIDVFSGRPVRVDIDGGTISSVEPLEGLSEERTNALPLVGPGLVDLQINGFKGIDFNQPSGQSPFTVADVQALTKILWAEGVTAYYPTVITNSDEAIETAVATIAAACEADERTRLSIPGIHVEGPFISPEDGARGAHGRQFVKAPDWELMRRWQRAARGLIKIVTLSPEWEGATDFIGRCVEDGITVSIGHTAATPEQIDAAVKAGATMCTHLGNGSHLQLPRHPNYIWEQLAQDRLFPCAIADGFHLPLSVLKVFRKVKPEQLMLVSDAVFLGGLEPGAYETHIGGKVVLTPEGKLHLADNPRLLAGSAQMLQAGIRHMVGAGLCSLAEGWEMASVRPAAFMGLAAARGLTAGAPADLVLFRWDRRSLELLDVYKHGQRVTSSSGSISSSHV